MRNTSPSMPVIDAPDDLLRRRVCELELLNATLRQHETALLRQAEELTRSNADLRQFACLAWHDLQEPLRAIGIYAQMLKSRYECHIDQDADRIIGFITDGVGRMEKLIEALLAFTRVGGSERNQRIESASAEKSLQEAISNLSLIIQESGAVINWRPLPNVVCASAQLTQLFQNLLSNAIKNRGPSPIQIDVRAESNGNECVFSIRDNGIGIHPDYQEKIFAPFKRVRALKYPGSGIGLALCRRIAESHGGRIWVDSLPGKGATFHFSLPVCISERSVPIPLIPESAKYAQEK